MTRFAWMCALERDQPEHLLEQALLADEVGFDAITCSDVFHPWVDDDGAGGFAWTWLGAVAARTSTLELITTVTSPLDRYHPAVIAQASATLDRLAPRRFVLGLGIGEPMSSLPLGFAPTPYPQRIERFREAVSVIRALWGGRTVSASGPAFPMHAARLYSPPSGHMRLWMAAAGPRSAEVAAEIADGVITSVKQTASSLERVVDPFRRSREERGAPGVVLATRWCILAENDDEAWEAIRPLRGLRVPGRTDVGDPAVLRRRADGMARRDVLAGYPIARTTDDLVSLYRPLAEDLRADYVSVQVASVDAARAIRLAGEELLPELRS